MSEKQEKGILYPINETIFIVDSLPLLFLKDVNVLSFSDSHLGIESIMAEDGTFVSKKQTDEMANLITKYVQILKPKILVINGDLKHSFSSFSKIENKEVKYFLSYIASIIDKVIIIKGNHDVFLNWVVRDIKNCEMVDDLIIGQYFFTHGHKKITALPSNINFVIIGHEHPLFQAKINNLEKIKAKTFMLGPLKNFSAKLIVMPAITTYSGGTSIMPENKNSFLSPILKDQVNIIEFETFVLDEGKDVFYFPKFEEWYTI